MQMPVLGEVQVDPPVNATATWEAPVWPAAGPAPPAIRIADIARVASFIGFSFRFFSLRMKMIKVLKSVLVLDHYGNSIAGVDRASLDGILMFS